jgi:hypothetical protein
MKILPLLVLALLAHISASTPTPLSEDEGEDVVDGLASLSSGVAVVEPSTGAVTSIRDRLTGATLAVVDVATGALVAVASGSKVVGSAVGHGAAALGQGAVAVGKGAVAGVVGVGAAVGQGAAAGVKGAASGVSAVGRALSSTSIAVVDTAAGTVTALVDTVSGAVVAVVNTTTGAVSSLADAAQSGAEGAATAARELADGVADRASTFTREQTRRIVYVPLVRTVYTFVRTWLLLHAVVCGAVLLWRVVAQVVAHGAPARLSAAGAPSTMGGVLTATRDLFFEAARPLVEPAPHTFPLQLYVLIIGLASTGLVGLVTAAAPDLPFGADGPVRSALRAVAGTDAGRAGVAAILLHVITQVSAFRGGQRVGVAKGTARGRTGFPALVGVLFSAASYLLFSRVADGPLAEVESAITSSFLQTGMKRTSTLAMIVLAKYVKGLIPFGGWHIEAAAFLEVVSATLEGYLGPGPFGIIAAALALWYASPVGSALRSALGSDLVQLLNAHVRAEEEEEDEGGHAAGQGSATSPPAAPGAAT